MARSSHLPFFIFVGSFFTGPILKVLFSVLGLFKITLFKTLKGLEMPKLQTIHALKRSGNINKLLVAHGVCHGLWRDIKVLRIR
jgi:hypothetical protein